MRTCTVDGCDRKHASRGWCQAHYVSWWKHGDPLYNAPLHRLKRKYVVDAETGCWQWTAYINPDGYGLFKYGGRMMGAHRVAYLLHVGDVPDGLELDHLCHNRACVNPDHLEPVPHRINVHRAVKPFTSTGVLGVSRHHTGYRASLTRDGKQLLAKTFRTLEEARAAVERTRMDFERSA